jgi:hypothetical protein
MLSKKRRAVLATALLVVTGSAFTISATARPAVGGDVLAPLSLDEQAGLQFMREEEKLARDSYIMLDDLWGVPVFANIATSEQSHMDAVKTLLDKYQDEVEDPVSDESDLGTFVDQHLQDLFDALMAAGEDSVMAALYVGGTIEETDMQDIQHWIDLADHEDIIDVYESLLCGSRNHLRAFVKQVENRGAVYEAQVLPQEVVDAIADSPTERDCGSDGGG